MKRTLYLAVLMIILVSASSCRSSDVRLPGSGGTVAVAVEQVELGRPVKWTRVFENEDSTRLAQFLRSLDCTGDMCKCTSEVHHYVTLGEGEKYDIQLDHSKVILCGTPNKGQCDLNDGQAQELRSILNGFSETVYRESEREKPERPKLLCGNIECSVYKYSLADAWSVSLPSDITFQIHDFLYGLEYNHVEWMEEDKCDNYALRSVDDTLFTIVPEYGYVKMGHDVCDLDEDQQKALSDIIDELEKLPNKNNIR